MNGLNRAVLWVATSGHTEMSEVPDAMCQKRHRNRHRHLLLLLIRVLLLLLRLRLLLLLLPHHLLLVLLVLVLGLLFRVSILCSSGKMDIVITTTIIFVIVIIITIGKTRITVYCIIITRNTHVELPLQSVMSSLPSQLQLR